MPSSSRRIFHEWITYLFIRFFFRQVFVLFSREKQEMHKEITMPRFGFPHPFLHSSPPPQTTTVANIQNGTLYDLIERVRYLWTFITL